MKNLMIIVSKDSEYVRSFVSVISELGADMFELSEFSSAESFNSYSSARHPNILITDESTVADIHPPLDALTIYLDDETPGTTIDGSIERVRKYQRISRIYTEILEKYSKIAPEDGHLGNNCTISVFWSPAGGTGTSTVAAAYATGRVNAGARVVYLDLEFFSSTSAFFPESSNSVSELFGAIASQQNLSILVAGLQKKDSGSGVFYFGPPLNYDDINVLTKHDLESVLDAVSGACDEVVVDLWTACDDRTKLLLERADKIYVVLDKRKIAGMKWNQFVEQHSVYKLVNDKITVVANRASNDNYGLKTIRTPEIRSSDPIVIFKSLSACSFS